MSTKSGVLAVNKNSGHIGTCRRATHDAGARPTLEAAPLMTPEATRAFIEEAYRKVGKPVPTVWDGRAFIEAQFVAEGKPIPNYWRAAFKALEPARAAEQRCTQVAPKTDLPTAVRSFKDNAAKVLEIAHGIASSMGMRIVEVPDEPVVQQYASPTSWMQPGRPVLPPERYPAPEHYLAQQFAEPTSPWGRNVADKFPEDTKNPIGDSDDPMVLRRRRATELERQIMDAKKRLASAGTADARARIDLELQEWSTELEAIREAERAERDEYKRS